jgi:hypothetical protein
MALRMLADAAKIPLDQQVYGYVTLNGTFNDIPRTFLLDTTLPGLAHRYADHSLSLKSREKWNETCPRQCTSNLTIPMLASEDMRAEVDPFAANLTFADISIPNFKSGRVCNERSWKTFLNIQSTANGVFGIGPGAPKEYPKVTGALDSIPWSKYSIYFTKTARDVGSFLLPGGADADLIAKQSLTETKLPATTETGWTVSVDAFSTTGASINAECSSSNPCSATIAASSPVMQLGKSIWSSVMAGIDRRTCAKTFIFGDQLLYECYGTDMLPNLTFTFGDRTLYMNATDYTIPIPRSDTRSVVVMISPQNYNRPYTAEWILGTPFLRSFYSSFDKEAKTVSFYCKDGVNCAAKGKPPPGSSSSSGAPVSKWLRASVVFLAATALVTVA